MKNTVILSFLLIFVLGHAEAQSKPQPGQQKPDPDRLGMTCAQILQMTSSDWIAKVTEIDDSIVDGQLRGIRVYGDCYDERTSRLAASLAKTGKGPRADALKDFQRFEAALKDFTAKAQEAAPGDGMLKPAYAALYEKQFRYAFYQSYEPKPASPIPGANTPAAAQKKAAPSASAITSAPPARQSSDTNDVTRAKNRFGKLLGALPEDKLHEVHAAFGEILGPHPVNGVTQLAVYRYAIFLLEPSSAKPFSPPPF